MDSVILSRCYIVYILSPILLYLCRSKVFGDNILGEDFGQIYRNFKIKARYEELIANHLAYATFTVPTLSICLMECTSAIRCIGLLYDTSTKQCRHLTNWGSYMFDLDRDPQSSLVSIGSRCRMERCLRQHILLSLCRGNPSTSWDEIKHGIDGKASPCFQIGTHTQCVQKRKPVYKDCQEAFEHGETDSMGLFFIRPTRSGRILNIRCVFDGFQGWTVIQSRYDGSTSFDTAEVWKFYEGFGDVTGEYWSGFQVMLWLQLFANNHQLHIAMTGWQGEVKHANYSNSKIEQTYKGLTFVEVSGYSGDAGDSMSQLTGKSVYYANKVRANETLCDFSISGAWWIDSCNFTSNLNGKWYGENELPSNPRSGIYWSTYSMNETLKEVQMMVGRDGGN